MWITLFGRLLGPVDGHVLSPTPSVDGHVLSPTLYCSITHACIVLSPTQTCIFLNDNNNLQNRNTRARFNPYLTSNAFNRQTVRRACG